MTRPQNAVVPKIACASAYFARLVRVSSLVPRTMIQVMPLIRKPAPSLASVSVGRSC
jgi:hypothetical protein